MTAYAPNVRQVRPDAAPGAPAPGRSTPLGARILAVLWLLVPSILWSCSLQSPVLCIDPLLFPALERRLPPRAGRALRWCWAALYLMALLVAWNVGPDTYGFYVREALPYAPATVLAALAVAFVAMLWFGAQGRRVVGAAPWPGPLFALGMALLLVKGLAAMEIVHQPSVRQALRSTTLISARRYLLPDRVGGTKTTATTPDRTFYALVKRRAVLPQDVVLMVVESWGETNDALARMAADVERRGFHIVDQGFTTYRGATLSGEIRELCGTYLQPSNALVADMATLDCAPQALHRRGYRVMGYHGFLKTFYARDVFWNRFGIGSRTFRDALPDAPRCPGPFPGVCDEALIRTGVGALDAAAGPAFLYMLTLSSHEPLDPDALKGRGALFNEVPVVHPTQVVTRRAISALVLDLQGRRRHACTLAYVVGDHQPPSASAKGGIFQSGKVPYLAFSRDCP